MNICMYNFHISKFCEQGTQSHSASMFMWIAIGKGVKVISSFMDALYMTAHGATTMNTWSWVFCTFWEK